jgi:S-DNA-T family DNA segregation ATPase FtsK/SpoIIIE
LLRGQGTYVSDDEINKVVEFVGTTEQQFVEELVQLKAAAPGESDVDRFKARDDLYEAAIDVVIREGRGSVSLLQRALGIGYGRAARLIDFMAEDGFVGTYNGSQAREVLISVEQWETMQGQSGGGGGTTEKPARPNKITPERDSGKASGKKLIPPPSYDDDEEDGYNSADDFDEEAEESEEDLFAERDEQAGFDDEEAEEADAADHIIDVEVDEDEVKPKKGRGRKAM